MDRTFFAVVPLLLAIAHSTADAQTERRTLDGDRVALYNLAGTVRVERGSGSSVVVEITRGGRDGSRLRLEDGQIRGSNTLRVIYPDDDIVYPRDEVRRDSRSDARNDDGVDSRSTARSGERRVTSNWWDHMGNSGSVSNLQIDDDGTWGNGRGTWGSRGRRVSIRHDGRGTEAWADIRVLVPVNRTVEVHLGVGAMSATGIDANLTLEVMSGAVRTDGTRGMLAIETGSGRVEVRDMRGDALHLETGSGTIAVANVSAARCDVETGSGGITGDGLDCEASSIETGSGSISLDRVGSTRTSVETGSGSVRLQLTRAPRDLSVETGSGGVTLAMPANVSASLDIDTGSGGIETDFAVQTTRVQRNRLVGTIGDGGGRIRVETGSGSVRLRRNDTVDRTRER